MRGHSAGKKVDPNMPNDNSDELKRYKLKVRFLVKGAEFQVHADTRRDLCICAEFLLRDMHARGFRPSIIAEGYGATNLIRTEKYLGGVLHDLDVML